MADSFDFKMFSKPVTDAIKDIERRTDRASMWALRETGRKTKQAAKRLAPVYQGQRGNMIHIRTVKKMRKAGMIDKATGLVQGENANTVIPGLLKDSISTSRRLKKIGETYVLRVAPWGPRVAKYSRKAEERKPFMAPAYDAVAPQMVEIHAKAWARANERR